MNGEHLEHELRQALGRVPPPVGFEERVLHRLPAPGQKQPERLRTFLALAATIALVVSMASYWRYQQKERERAEGAQQLIFALRLTAEKLIVVETRLKKSALQLQLKKTKEQL